MTGYVIIISVATYLGL